MVIRMKLIALLLCLLMSACASNVPYRTFVDEFKGTKTLSTGQVGSLADQPALSLTYVTLEAHYIKGGGPDRLTISISILSEDGWVFINRGESLVLLVDGKKMAFNSPEGSFPHRKVGVGKRITEIAFYPITNEQIRKISNAENVRVKVYGSNRTLERAFNESYKKAFDDFVIHVLEPNGL